MAAMTFARGRVSSFHFRARKRTSPHSNPQTWSLRAASTTCTKSARFAKRISGRLPRSQRSRTTGSSLTQRTEKADLPGQKFGLLQSAEMAVLFHFGPLLDIAVDALGQRSGG